MTEIERGCLASNFVAHLLLNIDGKLKCQSKFQESLKRRKKSNDQFYCHFDNCISNTMEFFINAHFRSERNHNAVLNIRAFC